MTAETGAGRFHKFPLNFSVAFLALDFRMRTIQFEPCGRMIEVPCLPGPRRVTRITFLPESAFVFVILVMASMAGQRSILERRGEMALLALDSSVTARQSKARFVVIVLDAGPSAFKVTRFTFFTQLAFVLVILLVTGHAGLLQFRLAIKRPLVDGMAIVTLGVTMLALERVFRVLVVVEDREGPPLRRVAGGALDPITSLVTLCVVLFAVAGITVGFNFYFSVRATDATGMAAVAFGILMLFP